MDWRMMASCSGVRLDWSCQLLCRVGRILLVVISRLHVSAAIAIFRASEIERKYASNDFQGGADASKVRDATDGA